MVFGSVRILLTLTCLFGTLSARGPVLWPKPRRSATIPRLPSSTSTTASPVTSTPDWSHLEDWLNKNNPDVIDSSINSTTEADLGYSLVALELSLSATNGSGTWHNDNLGVSVKKLDKQAFAGLYMEVSNSNSISVEPLTSLPQLNSTNDSVIQVMVPQSLKSKCKNKKIPLNMAVYKVSSKYRKTSKGILSDRIVCLSVTDEDIYNLTDHVTIRYIIKDDSLEPEFYENVQKSSARNEEAVCVWWNTAASIWSSDGCTSNHIYTTDGTIQYIDCECTHFTSFALMVTAFSNTPDAKNFFFSEEHYNRLKILSTIGVGLSITGLTLAMIMFLCSKPMRRHQNQKILFQLNLSLLLFLILYLVAGLTEIDNKIGCTAVGAFLHYFTLVTFSWMLTQSVHMYLSLVKVFNTYIRRFMLKAALIAWIVPVIFPISVLIANASIGSESSMYDHPSKACFLSGLPMYLTLLVPVSIIVIVNISLFIRSMWALKQTSCMKVKGSKISQLSFLIKAGIALSVLLGGTWVLAWPVTLIMDSYLRNDNHETDNSTLGMLYLVFGYAFSILTSTQGFFIFIIHFLRPALRKSKVWTDFRSRFQNKRYEQQLTKTTQSSMITRADTSTNIKLSTTESL